MYDVLFIDDKFEEVKETFCIFQKEHIRCFYSDGDKYLPNNNKERLPFKNLKYICLDLHLENRGIDSFNSKNTISVLSEVVKSFTKNKDVCIIINTSFSDEFDEHKEIFFKYLGFKPKIKIEKKKEKFSSLHEKEIKNEIIKKSHQSLLRNVVIREAIEIENLIWDKVLSSDVFKDCNEKNDILKKLNIRMSLSKKIEAYNRNVNPTPDIKQQLNDLKEKRNCFAHKKAPLEINLLDFLEKIENLTQKINHKSE